MTDFSAPPPRRLVTRHGPLAERWWAGLGEVVASLAARWDIEVGEPVGRGNTSFVVRCRRADGRAAVLKLNVLDAGPDRGLVAIDPRACAGDPAFDAVDWVFWRAQPTAWRARARELATRLGCDEERLWAWCTACAAMLAASEAARAGDPARVQALLALVP